MRGRAAVLTIVASLVAAGPAWAQTERPTRPPDYTRPPVTRPPFTRPPSVTRPPGRTRPPATRSPRPERSPASLDALRRRGIEAVDRRLARLDELLTKMGVARRLKEDHRKALQEQIDAEKAGLRELRTKIEGDTDVETLRADLRAMVEDYRVYLLVAPKVHLMLTADRALAAAALLETLAGKLQDRIDGGAPAGAQAALDSMRTHIAAARNAAQGIPDKVIPLLPGDFPGNRSVLGEARESLKTAREELRLARDEARKVVDALRSPSPAPSPTATA